MQKFVNHIFRLEHGEWPKLVQFGLFGFLLQMGMGIGFSAGDAAFLSNVGADSLPVIFLLTPVVMLLYTGVFSYLLVRSSIGNMVDFTLGALIAGGATLWALLDAGLDPEWQTILYYMLKLYLAVWYIALYTLFWNFTDTYFDIQDAKRLFPLFAAFCALGTATGALFVSLFAGSIPMHYFLLIWAAIALITAPLARYLRRRWGQIAENDMTATEDDGGTVSQLAEVGRAFRNSRYAIVLTMTLFVTLLMTNLAEFQYSKVLQDGRSEAELASLLGALYAAANLFNLVVCLFVFNRLVARFGVRNVAFIQPLTYFAVFGYFFLQGGTGAALAAFFAYHGVLTSIQYNNENLLFNAVPSHVKRPLRTVMEGMCEPVASLVAGGFLLYAANYLDMRELSGIGVITGIVLIAVVVALRQLYPAALAANMRFGWLNFGDRSAQSPQYDPDAYELLETIARIDDGAEGNIARDLLQVEEPSALPAESAVDLERLVLQLDAGPEDREVALNILATSATAEDFYLIPELAARLPDLNQKQRLMIIDLFGRIGDVEAIPEILTAAGGLSPRDRRAVAAILAAMGETAIPRLLLAMGDGTQSYRIRSIAARALVELSFAQFMSHLDKLVQMELRDTGRLLASADRLERSDRQSASLVLLARIQRERVAASIDFALELLSLGGRLPNADLLIVSLHSANAKVRGNAIETIESGVDNATFRQLKPLLRAHRPVAGEESGEGDIDDLLEKALRSGRSTEAAAAADILHEMLDDAAFSRRMQSLVCPDMPWVLRGQLLALHGLAKPGCPPALQILEALSQSKEFGGATLESLLTLAEKARWSEPDGSALQISVKDTPGWILHSDIRDIATRYSDLALVLLRSMDGRRYAA
ncbi:MFS transporter [uncultured Parasphingorhabdus sp.]|uniref:MFS transporter n=1 Tax=uncultured Parasphingorhabdus sp. TaxID=2709694 RepID=UPI0030DA071C